MMGGRLPQGSDAVGQTVANFPTYEAAQKAVSSLIAADIPARDIAIVGQGLRSVERITGRLGYAAAARSGAVNGVLLGLLFSAILVIGSPSVPIQAFVGVLFVGIAIGMLFSIVAYSFVRRRRDYASVMQVLADHYEVTVAQSSVQRARQVLGPLSSAPGSTPASASAAAPAPAAPQTTEPPKYGERVAAPADAGAPQTGAPQTGAPQTGVPQTGAPQTGVPQIGAPQTGAPQTGAPQTGAPQSDAPQTDAPHPGAPEARPAADPSDAAPAGEAAPADDAVKDDDAR